MKIEAGKFYRMRCGGAVKIEYVDNDATTGPHSSIKEDYCWYRGGVAFPDEVHPFDLIAEITEAEYSRIVSGKESDAILDMAQNAVMQSHYEVEELKRHNANLHRNLEAWESDYATLRAENETLKEERSAYRQDSINARRINDHYKGLLNHQRFEAAKEFMSAIIAHSYPHVAVAVEGGIEYADALIKALEETK